MANGGGDQQEMEVASDSDDTDRSESTLGMTKDTLDAIDFAKRNESGLFVSGWDVDEEGVAEKDLMDPGEQVLTAAEDGNLDQLQNLLGEDMQLLKLILVLSVRDSDQYTPLHRAAYNNHADVVTYLLSIGADPKWRTENGWTPLHCAACWGCELVVPILLAHGVDVNARSNGDLTALHLGVACSDSPAGALKAVECLLEAPGVDINAVSGAGESPIMIARRTSKAMTELLERYLNK